MHESFLIFLSFIIGSIPTGYILVKTVRKRDIRKSGSGNIGFSNVLRSEGPVLGFTVLVIDVAKAFAATFFLSRFSPHPPLFRVLAGVAILIGNIFSPFLRFKGGKGVATGLGVALAVNPIAAGTAVLVFGITVKIWKYISLGSLSAALVFAITSGILCAVAGYDVYSFFFALLILVVVSASHTANIRRLVQGRENKIGKDHGSG